MQYSIKHHFAIVVLFISDQWPTKTDSQQLIFCLATLQEIQRISTVALAAAPHASTEDVVMNGYYIPKGTIFLANLRKFSKDPEIFPDPNELIPERFIEMHQKSDDRTATLKVYNYFYRLLNFKFKFKFYGFCIIIIFNGSFVFSFFTRE